MGEKCGEKLRYDMVLLQSAKYSFGTGGNGLIVTPYLHAGL